MNDNLRGALLMTTCMVAFTINDAFLKVVLGQLPLLQTLFLRGLLTSIGLLAIGFAMSSLRMPPANRDRALVLLRTVAEIAAAWLFLTALSKMPLANVSAILQVLPLAVTLTSAMVFGEPLGWRRLSAIAAGFCGVLLIVRPGTEDFDTYALYALASVAAVTVRDLCARRLSRSVPSIWVALVTSLGVTVASGIAAALGTWVPVEAVTAGNLIASSGLVIVGYLASVAAMRVGDVGVVAPFRYTGLLAALILGFVVFDEWPAVPTLIGAGIIVATGVFTLRREMRLARCAAQTAPVSNSVP